jgi:hypothetical protein
MADPVAIVSVVSGAAVALGVPFINARLERTRLEHQSRHTRLEELRVLLDDAVQHLYDAWTILYEIGQESERGLPRPEWSDEYLRGRGKDLTEQTDVLVHDGLRIALRTHSGAPIVAVHDQAQQYVIEYELYFRRFLESELFDQEKPPEPPITDLSAATSRFMDEVRQFVGAVSEAAEAGDQSPSDSISDPA